MLYLEDYLEMIEHLPQELRDRFTEMREMDLSVQNRVDSLEDKQKVFFTNCRRMKPGDRATEYEKIRKEYERVIEDSSEKIQNAEESYYNLVDRYLRKLDQELHKFKLELEADHRGITEILEKRSLEMDAPTSASAKENRLPKKNLKKNQTIAHASSSSASSASSVNLGGAMDRGVRSADHRKSSFVFSDGIPGLDTSLPSPGVLTPGPASAGIGGSATYPIQHMGAGGNAIAAAASQAIAATQQMVPGRRTSSLKASYEAINLGSTHEFSIGRELAGAAQSALAATSFQGGGGGGGSGDGAPATKKHKSSKRSGAGMDLQQQHSVLDVVSGASAASAGASSSAGAGASAPPFADDPSLLGEGPSGLGGRSPGVSGAGGDELAGPGEGDWNYDPSEPRYCVCNQVSYGDMVACDNDDCPYEWFHYPCVGITAPPKGKWYCPTCLARRKGSSRK